MKQQIYDEIHKVFARDFVLESPKDKNLAHFASPIAFSLAKELKRSPVQIATELADKFKENPCFESVQGVNGYVNFKISKSYLNAFATKALQNKDEFSKGEAKTIKFLLEFVSANPTGPLHIGHARGAIFGDTLARLGRHLGYKFDTEYYINDAGKQIKLLGLSVLLAVKKHCLKQEVSYPDEYYKGEYIVDLAKLAFDEFEPNFFTEHNILKLALWAKDKMLEVIKQDLSKVQVSIENYVSELSYYAKFDEIINALKKNGGVYEKEGKIWLASSMKNDEKDRVIVNEKNERSYLAADIVYHADKMSRKYDKCINIWGADHHGYIARVKAALEFLGFDSSKLEIILAQMVSLLQNGKPYKMSKRAGNFILMDEIINEIGSDALRFIFLSKKCDTHLEFDIDTLKKQDSSNPVFYINYAHARIYQVFRKANKSFDDVLEADFTTLNEDGINLLFESLNLKSILQSAFEERALQKISDYLKNLAALFHKFYSENRVVGSLNEDSLLKLFAVVALSIKTAFHIMGIEAQKQMG